VIPRPETHPQLSSSNPAIMKFQVFSPFFHSLTLYLGNFFDTQTCHEPE